MKKQKLIGVLYAIVVIIIGSLIWWNVPCSLTNIEPSEVSKIEVFNGNTGKLITIIDIPDIEHIIKSLNTVSIKKEKISLGYMGYSFLTKIYNINGTVYKEFIINSNNTIRKDPFFYRDSSENIDFEYIEKLFDKGVK